MKAETIDDAFEFLTLTGPIVSDNEISRSMLCRGKWVSTEDGSPLYIEDGVAKTGPSGKAIDSDQPKKNSKLVDDAISKNIPEPKSIRIDNDAVNDYSADIVHLANSGKSPGEIAEHLLSGQRLPISKETSPEVYNVDDRDEYFDAVRTAVESRLGEEDTINGQDWEDFASDAAFERFNPSVKLGLTKAIETVIAKPVDSDTADSVENYLKRFGKAPVGKQQHVDKIAERFSVTKQNAEKMFDQWKSAQ